MRKFTYFFLFLFFAVGIFTQSAAAATYPRTSPNLHPNPELTDANGWMLPSGVTFNSTVSKGSGGSIQINPGKTANGPLIPVTPAQDYTCGFYFMGQTVPTDFVRLAMGLYKNGTHLRNGGSPSDWMYRQAGVWTEAVIFLRDVPADVTHIRLIAHRASHVSSAGGVAQFYNGEGPMYIDNMYCGQGISFDKPASAKKIFNGDMVKVDGEGNFFIRQANGTFKREFLRCAHVQNRPDLTIYGNKGWNCNMWASSKAHLQKSVDAGMPYAFFQLTQFIHKGAWGYGNLTLLRNDLSAVLNSPMADHLVGYYYDNESPQEYKLAKQVFAIVREMDTKNGRRQRPIYILQGSFGRQVAYVDEADVTGSYNLSRSGLFVLENLSGQTTPIAFGQIQQEENMATAIYQVLKDGATAIGYWHNRPIENEPWYNAFPSLVAKILTELPVVNPPPDDGVTPTPSPTPSNSR